VWFLTPVYIESISLCCLRDLKLANAAKERRERLRAETDRLVEKLRDSIDQFLENLKRMNLEYKQD
jgi:hypothetical protein